MNELPFHSYTTKNILSVYSLNKENLKTPDDHIGNKAGSLVELSHWKFDVPDSIILDDTFYEHFLVEKKIPIQIFEIIDNRLSSLLAIRSSSNLEDSDRKSFAGMFKTILNVPNTPSEIKKAIKQCYQSFSKYTQRNNHEEEASPYMGIIVQSMISPKISGIVFTRPVVNPDEKLYQIEFSSGYGDKLTGGDVSGDYLQLDIETGKIVKQKGNIFISQEAILNLWQIIRKLETKRVYPQDAEFVVSETDDKIYLVQSRPITAFQYSSEYVIKNETEKLTQIFNKGKDTYGFSPILTATNISELFPVANPLSYSVFKTIFTGTREFDGAYNIGRKKLGYEPVSKEEQEDLFLTIGDQARSNLLIHTLIYCLKGLDKQEYLELQVRHYFQDINKDEKKGNYAQNGVYIQNPTLVECLELYPENGEFVYQVYSKFISDLFNEKIPKIKKSIPGILKQNNRFYRKEIRHKTILDTKEKFYNFDKNGLLKINDGIPPSQLYDSCKHYIEYLRTDFGVNYVIIARLAFLCPDIVKGFLEKLYQSNKDSLFPDIGTKDDSELLNICLNSLLTSKKSVIKENRSKISNLFFRFLFDKSTKTFRKVYGFKGELDISRKRLGESEDEILKGLMTTPEEAPKKKFNGQNKWLKNFYIKLRQLSSGEEFDNFHSWLEYASFFLGKREAMKLELLKILYLIRSIIEKIAREIHFGDLIYFLNWNELEECMKNPVHYRFVALKRKAYFHACESIEVSKVIMENRPENIQEKQSDKDYDPGEYRKISGTTICHGKAEGFCLTAKNSYEFHRKLILYRREGIENIIGVFKSVDPAYIKICELRGFITENGGFLAHAATIARESNVPYIFNIKVDVFRDRQYVVIDTKNEMVVYQE